jgi:uncharacterized protein YecE (DUF72 family)
VIRVGPAGWSYPDWEGKVYPLVKPAGFHPLRFLARYVDCVEINASFYALPRAEHARRWVELVADRERFRFVVKLWREFTHVAAPADGDGGWDERARLFLAGIEPLRRARRLSALLVQFPVSFLYGPAEVRRLGRLSALFSEVPLVLEVRHASWYAPPALDTLRALSYSLAHIDLPAAWNHPPPWHAATGPIGYLRLHGRNARTWFDREADRDARYDYLYAPDELHGVAERARRIAREHADVFVVTNNHFEGQAVANALELLHALGGEPVLAPRELVETYPRLAAIARVEGQQTFF